MKRCTRCATDKPLSEFYRRVDAPTKWQAWCKPCRNAYARERYQRNKALRDRVLERGTSEARKARRAELLYGMAPGEYDARLAAQGGVCAICGNPDQRYKLSVDHDHITGAVRGLLCNNCNRGIGLLKDSAELLDAAARYLREGTECATTGTRSAAT